MSQVDLLSKVRTKAYNCAHFAGDVWEHETGEDIRPILTGFLAVRRERRITSSLHRDFIRIENPVSPCIVLFRHPEAKVDPHVGVYLRGKVLHLDGKAPIRQEVQVIAEQNQYTSVRYYAPR